MKTLTCRITLGLAVLLMAGAPVGFNSDDGLEVVCANAQGGCKPQWRWVCFGEEDYEDRCPLTDDYCEKADPTFPPPPKE